MVHIKADSVNGFSLLSRELDRHAQWRQSAINTKEINVTGQGKIWMWPRSH